MFERKFRFTRVSGFRLAFIAVCFLAVSHQAVAKWHVPAATVRYRVALQTMPTHKANGFYVTIPDGGILPKPFPQAHVIEYAGPGVTQPTLVKSYVLWQNQDNGLGLIFERPPHDGELYIYVSPTEEVQKWTEASGLKPSPFLVCMQGVANREANEKLAVMGSMPNTVHWRRYASWWKTAVCIPGDMTGYLGPVSVYLSFYYQAREPGKTLFGKITYMGKHQMRYDGKDLPLKGFSGKRGGVGGWVDNVTPGLHRIEWLCWNGGGHAPFRGFMAMTVITPKTQPGQMGGVNHTGDGKPFWASRLVRGNEVTWSGEAGIVSAEMRNGAPVASIVAKPVENFWFDEYSPVVVYKLDPMIDWYPKNARYIWQFEGGAIQQRPSLHWLIGDNKHHRVTLTVDVDGKHTTCKVPLFPYVPETMVWSTMNNPETPERYRKAAYDMFNAYPADKDPTASWSSSYWSSLFRCIDIGVGDKLLIHLKNVRWKFLVGKLEKERLDTLRFMCMDIAPRMSPQLALKWAKEFEEAAEDEREKAAMRVARAEVYMFYLEDYERAKAILMAEARTRILDPVGELARVRLGDIAFIKGEINEARMIYAAVQKRAKHKKRNKAKAEKAQGGPMAEWKLDALLSVAESATAKSLVDQGYLTEAKQEMLAWELEFPLNKLNADLILNNAKLYMSMEDWQRAQAMLEPYCDYVDISSFLPDAIRALLKCKLEQKAPMSEIVEFCKKQKGKMKFHPVGRELDYYLKLNKKKELEAAGGVPVDDSAPAPKASALTKSQLLQKAMGGGKK